MARYEVDHYQLNCAINAAGDSSITLLVFKDPVADATAGRLGTIRSAVLIDGGQGVEMCEKIEKVITEIERTYTFTSTTTRLQLDAVCVTHWDKDHYYGLNWWLKKYGVSLHLKFVGKTPGTRFYSISAWSTTDDAAGAPKWGFMDQKFVPNLDNESVLGKNLFNGKGLAASIEYNPATKTYDDITGLAELITNNDPWNNNLWADNGGAPGFYIIGANKVLLGDVEPIAADGFDSDEEEENLGDGRLGVIDKSNINVQNFSSLVTLVVWKNKDTTKSPKVSFYTAGDAEYAVENKVATFVNGEQIQIYKGGHHGSTSSTSAAFVKAVRPDHFIYSAGIMFAHPVPEIILYLDAWFSQNPAVDDSGNTISKRLHATCYPYHLGCVRVSAHADLEPYRNEFTKADKMTTLYQAKTNLRGENLLYQRFIGWLLKQYKAIDPTNVPDPITDFSNKVADYIADYIEEEGQLPQQKDPIERTETVAWKEFTIRKSKYLFFHLATMWGKWSKVTYPMYPVSAFKNKTPPTGLVDLDYVLARMSYIQTGNKNALRANITLCKTGDIADVKAAGDEPLAKAVNIDDGHVDKKDTDSDVNVSIDGDDTDDEEGNNLQAVAPANLSSNAAGLTATENNNGPTQRGLKRAVPDADELYLTPQDEAWLHAIEKADDVDALINSDFWPPRRYVVVRKPRQTLRQLGAAPAVPNQIGSATGTTGDTIVNLVLDSNNESFVSCLRARCLVLANVAKDASGNYTANLDALDVLQQWLQCFFTAPFGASSASLNISSASPWNFTLQIPVLMPAGNGGATQTVRYDSAISVVKSAFTVASDVSLTVDDYGFFMQSTGLVLGLSKAVSYSNVAFTISDLYLYLEMGNPPVFLDQSATLKIDDSPASSNGTWICPGENQALTHRMTLAGTTASAYLIVNIPGFIFSNSKIVSTKAAYLQASASSGGTSQLLKMVSSSLCIQTSTQLSANDQTLKNMKWTTYLILAPTTVSLILRFSVQGTGLMAAIISWLGSASGPNLDLGSAWSNFSTTISNLESYLHLRELYLSATYVNNGWKIKTFWAVFELDLAWGITTANTHVPVRMAFAYSAGVGGRSTLSFDGRLWTDGNADVQKLLPSSPPYPPLNPIPNSQSYFSLYALMSEAQKAVFPTSVLPTAVTALQLTIGTQALYFGGILQQDPAQPAPDPKNQSWIQLERVQITAAYDFTTFSFDFQAQMIMTPRAFLAAYTATLDVEIAYISGQGWSFVGSASNVNVGAFYSLFPSADSQALMNVLEDITVKSLTVTMSPGPTDSEAKSFGAAGVLQLGDVTMTLDFQRNTAATGSGNWWFKASLMENFSLASTTVGSLIGSISSDIASMLPDMIANIPFSVPANSKITLNCVKKASGILFSLVVDIGMFQCAFVQLSNAVQPAAGIVPQKVAPKRLFKIAMDTLPDVQGVPLLDKLSQPFDQLDFFWLSQALTRQEVADVNSTVFLTRQTKLVYTDPVNATSDPRVVTTPGKSSPTDIVIVEGCHFQVVVEQNNAPTPVVDYAFTGQVTPTPSDGSSGFGAPVVATSNATNASAAGSATGKWTKTIGPLTIGSIGLKLDQGYLYIMLDASVKLGPMAGAIKGFGIGIPLGANMHSIDTSRSVSVIFSSIGVELIRPPVELAGELVKTLQGYEGGIVIQIEPYTILAAGGYYDKVVDPKTHNTFKSMFVFAELAGPLAELELASLNDVCGGVGYNSRITLPTIDNVTTFPFLVTADANSKNPNQISPPSASDKSANDPLSILNSYLNASPPWFTPADGPAWIAAGVMIKAFASLTLKTVVVVDLSEDVIFGLYADVTADFPAGVQSDAALFARVDMGLLAEINPSKGIFHAEGQLTPKSFIFDKSCRLSGGFALCYWFDGSGHSGDWVFTIGGYHSAFRPPLWYPVPKRLAINWKFDEISLSGEAYFAITPKVCMGGGKLNLAYRSGSLYAYLNAYADFLINYKPFSFQADVGVAVGVQYTVNVWFASKTFDVHFGSTLSLHGPPLAGTIHITLSFISFDIHFGPGPVPAKALNFAQFYTLLLQLPENTPINAADVLTGQGMHTITPNEGVVTNSKNQLAMVQQETDKTVVLVNKSSFSFSFASAFPVTSVTYYDGIEWKSPVPATNIKPMHISSGITAKLLVEIKEGSSSSGARFTWEPIYKQVPTAMWGAYDPNADASTKKLDDKNMSSVLDTNGATIQQLMGIQFKPPNLTISQDQISFNIEQAGQFPASTATIPGAIFVPASVGTQAKLDSAINVAAPMTPDVPYASRTVLGRISYPKIAKTDIMMAWMKWTGVTTDAPLGKRLSLLSTSAGTAPNWIAELANKPTTPLPLLTAEASVKALQRDGTRFAKLGGYRGPGAMLNRDWLDGGYL